MFKTPFLAASLSLGVAHAADQVVTLGDSLTFAYEAEFCFSQTITGFGTIGDGFPLTVRNWIEILSDPAYRGNHFDLGARDNLTVDPPADPPFTKYFRQAHNWAIPGLTVDGMRRFLTGESTFRDLLDDDPGFGTIDLMFDYSDYTPADFALSDFQSQVQNTAERMVIFVGGNDINAIYGTIYNGGSAGSFVADFMADMTAILDIVQGLKPNLPIVLVNVPHVGITQLVRESYPFHAVNTERVSAVLRDLNAQLLALANARGIGYADVYSPTLEMTINSGYYLTIHGLGFANQGTTPTNLNPVWLNGTLSKRFHPNTSAQAVVANEIIHAFNDRYNTGIAPLTATEMLVGLLGRTPTQADMTFATWHGNFFLGETTPPGGRADDSDGDGIPAGAEFALGLNPERHDSRFVRSRLTGGSLELSYPIRLASSTRYTLTPQSSNTLSGLFTPVTPTPTTGADGLARATIPAGPGKGFLRLKADVP